jgi:ribosome biogenesis protein SSF1/2
MTKSKKTVLQKKHARIQSEQFEKSLNNPPRSIIFRRGLVGESVKKLIKDLRWVMSPFTAKRLRDSAKNTVKDFLRIAGPFQVTHFMVLLQTAAGLNLKVTRIPRGPSLYFRVLEYTTMESIRAKQKQVNAFGSEYKFAPLVVLNNFSGGEDHKRIMAAVFQNMFPAIDITTMRLANCRRVVLINYNTDSDTIDFRHYEISAVPVGLTKGIRKIIKGKLVDLHSRDDIADYVDNPNTMSDSEAELPEDARVTLSQSVHGRGNLKQQTSAIKLKELGPRMTLQLFKIEEGLFEGNVMYHKFVTKTEEEAMAIAQRREAKRAEKEGRKNEQEANVLRKQQEQEAREKLKNEKRAAREAARALIAKDEYDESDSDSDSEEEVEPDYKHTGPVDMDDEDDEEDGEMAFDDEDDDDNSEGKVIEFDDDEEEEESEESEPAPKKGRFNKRK